MNRYQAIRNVGLGMLLVACINQMQLPVSAQTPTVLLDFSSGGVVAKGVVSYAMNRCRLEDMGDQNRRLRLFPGDKFSFTVNFPAAPEQVTFKIEHSFAEDPSKLAPKIKPSAKPDRANPVVKPAPLSLYVNGSLVHSWPKFSGSFKAEEVTVGNLKRGLNTFELRFVDDHGISSYWIKSIKI